MGILGFRVEGLGWLSKLWSLLGSLNIIRCRIIIGIQKGTISLTTTHVNIPGRYVSMHACMYVCTYVAMHMRRYLCLYVQILYNLNHSEPQHALGVTDLEGQGDLVSRLMT